MKISIHKSHQLCRDHARDQGGNDRVMILARADLLVLSLSVLVEELIIVDTVVCGCKLQRSTVDDGEVVSCFESARSSGRSLRMFGHG